MTQDKQDKDQVENADLVCTVIPHLTVEESLSKSFKHMFSSSLIRLHASKPITRPMVEIQVRVMNEPPYFLPEGTVIVINVL